MSVSYADIPNLVDDAKRGGMDTGTLRTIEILEQKNSVLQSCCWIEGATEGGHVFQTRAGLVEVTWLRHGYGTQPVTPTTEQHNVTAGRQSVFYKVDAAVIERGGMKAQNLQNDIKGVLQSCSHDMARNMWYGNEKVTPERFTGFAQLYNTTSSTKASSANVIDAGGMGSDNRSIWVVGWAKDKVTMFYPRGRAMGMQSHVYSHSADGSILDQNAPVRDEINGGDLSGVRGNMRAYARQFEWYAGLAVMDWRYVVRICNIDVSDLRGDASMGANLIDLLHIAVNRLESTMDCMPVIYAPRGLMEVLDRQHVNFTKESTLTREDSFGRGWQNLVCQGIPIMRGDELDVNEARVT